MPYLSNDNIIDAHMKNMSTNETFILWPLGKTNFNLSKGELDHV
jgi:hypothetical protein